MTLKVQFCSDLHLEFRDVSEIPKLLKNINSDVLCLVGDITTVNDKEDFNKFIKFLQYYSPKYKYLIHIAGNHEFYHIATSQALKANCMDMVHKKLKLLNKMFPNYLYLNCDTVTLTINNSQYMFIGATLWTKVPLEKYEKIQNGMNDYQHIYFNKNNEVVKLTVPEIQRLHNRHYMFIKRSIEVANNLNIPTILITHHKPITDENSRQTEFTIAYEVDITKIIKPIVKLAIHGHTHKNYNKLHNGTQYVSNPKGYPGQHTGFKPDLAIALD
jgi:predicted phosphodiesterase